MASWSNIVKSVEQFNSSEEDDPWYINTKTFNNALKTIKVLEGLGMPVPKIFSHGGDCVVFVWENENYTFYFNVGDDEALPKGFKAIEKKNGLFT